MLQFNIWYRKERNGSMKLIEKTALLFSAGLGTRLKPFTLSAPKALYPIQGEPMIEKNIRYLKKYGFNRFVVNVHHFADKIEEFFKKNDDFGVEVIISDERNELLETGGGLVKAKPYLENGNFLVMNTDILTDLDIDEILEFHQNNNPLVTLAVSKRESSRKLLFSQDGELSGWENMKTREKKLKKGINYDELVPFSFSGIHVISPEIFSLIEERGKFSIIESYLKLMNTQKILAFTHQAQLYDIGKPETASIAEKNFIPKFSNEKIK